MVHGYYWSTGQRCPDWTQTVKYQHSFDPIVVTCKTPSVPALGPMEDFRRFSGQSPGSIYSPPRVGGGSFYFPACWGCLQSGARTVCTNAFLTSVTATLGESEIPVQTSSVILFWVITADFFNSLVGQMMVWDPLWGFNPTIMRLKIQWFPYSTKSSSAPFLLPRTSQSILHSDCFNWFKHISQEFKRFQTATWS